MTVGFDLTWMDNNNTSGGVYQYAFRIISALVEHTDVTVIAIIGPTGVGIFDHLKEYANFKAIILEASNSFKDLIEAEKIDVVHTPIQSHTHYTLSVPMIITLHDLQHFHYPEFFSEEEIASRNTYYKKSAEFSERVIVSYQHVKDDIVKFYNIPPDKIDVCPLGMPVPKEVDQSIFSVLKEKYHLPDKYLFYSANAWRHKNHSGLLKALRLVHDKYGIKIPLVCTGYKYDDYFPEIEKLIDELGIGEYVNFTGYIPDEDMVLLLTNATLVVIPTLYEAGSFPLMEAMIYEVPVICSNVTSLPDTIGDSRFTFDPTDDEKMAGTIVKMLEDSHLVMVNIKNSRERREKNSWHNLRNNFVETYARADKQFKQKKVFGHFRNWLLNFDFLVNAEVAFLKNHVEISEADRAARLEVINKLSAQLQESEADRAARLEVIHTRDAELSDLNSRLRASEEKLREKCEEFCKIDADLKRKCCEIAKKENEIKALKSSFSWKITAPFRFIYEWVRRIKKGSGLDI